MEAWLDHRVRGSGQDGALLPLEGLQRRGQGAPACGTAALVVQISNCTEPVSSIAKPYLDRHHQRPPAHVGLCTASSPAHVRLCTASSQLRQCWPQTDTAQVLRLSSCWICCSLVGLLLLPREQCLGVGRAAKQVIHAKRQLQGVCRSAAAAGIRPAASKALHDLLQGRSLCQHWLFPD